MARLFAEHVASGRLDNCRLMRLSAQRYLDMLEMAEDPKCEFIFSPAHVVQYCLFVEKLQHVESGNWEITQVRPDGTVDPHIILEPSQIWEEAAIQGFRRRIDGTRLTMIALQVKPRKSAKSLTVAGAALFDLTSSGQVAPQVVIAASTVNQADRVFGPIGKFINKDTDLVDEFQLDVTKEVIRCNKNDGVVMKLSSIGERQDGLNPSLAILEEGHAGAEGVYNVVRSAFGARPNALLRMITTAGYHPSGPGWNLLQQAIEVLEGRSETWTFFAAIYTLDEDDYLDKDKDNAIRWDRLLSDESLVRKANPMYGVSLMPHMLAEDREEARRSPTGRAEYARTRFNLWVGQGATAIEAAAWAACKTQNLSLEDFIGQRCWIGVDLASKRDMCAIALLFEMPDDRLAIFAQYYLPQASSLAQDINLGDTIRAWADDPRGFLILTPGAGADFARILGDIRTFCELFDVQVIACDPYQAAATSQQLWGDGRPVMDYPNNAMTMTGPVDDILTRIADRTICHDGNPVLAWNAANAEAERGKNGSIMFRRGNDIMKKIDGLVAAAMANGCRIQPDNAKDTGPEVKPQAVVPRVVGYEEIVGS